MKLTRELAQKIVHNTMDVLGKNINIMDHNGIIIGSGKKNRINNYHEGAAKIIENGEPYVINGNMAKNFQGVEAGINLPIKFQDNIIGVVGITGNIEEVSSYGKIVKNMVELILQQEFLLHEIELENRTKENLYQQLIGNTIEDKELLNDRIKLLNINTDLHRAVLVIKVLPFDNKKITNQIRLMYKTSFIKSDDMFLVRGDNIVLIKSLKREKLKNKGKELIKIAQKIKGVIKENMFNNSVIGIGQVFYDVDRMHLSYEGAKLAIEVGAKVNSNKNDKIYYINHLGYDYFLPSINIDSKDFFLHNLFDHNIVDMFKKTDIGETIEALVRNDLNISKTAKNLYIHRNTLLYRLNKIKEMTGLDPKNANNLFTLLLAYHLYLYEK